MQKDGCETLQKLSSSSGQRFQKKSRNKNDYKNVVSYWILCINVIYIISSDLIEFHSTKERTELKKNAFKLWINWNFIRIRLTRESWREKERDLRKWWKHFWHWMKKSTMRKKAMTKKEGQGKKSDTYIGIGTWIRIQETQRNREGERL